MGIKLEKGISRCAQNKFVGSERIKVTIESDIVEPKETIGEGEKERQEFNSRMRDVHGEAVGNMENCGDCVASCPIRVLAARTQNY